MRNTVILAFFLSLLLMVRAEASEPSRMIWSRDLSRLQDLPIIKNNIVHLLLTNQERTIQLFRSMEKGNSIEHDLAESSNFDPITNVLEVKLRTDCGWSDGTPITAYDVKAGIEAVFSPEAVKTIAGRDAFRNGKAVFTGLSISALGIEAIDATTLRIPTVVSQDLLKMTLTLPQYTPMPLHKIKSDPEYWTRTGMPTVASGPYFPVSVTSERIVMHKNPYFCGDDPVAFDEVVIFNSSGSKDDLRLIQQEQLSIFGHNAFWRNDAGVNLREINDTYRKIPQAGLITDFLFLNVQRPAFADERVRQAFKLALEIPDFSSEALAGATGYIAKSIIPVTSSKLEYPHELGPRAERIERARKLMAEAGYSEEKPLLLKFLSRMSHARVRVFTHAIRSMISSLPIKLEIDWQPSTKEFYNIARLRGKTDYDMHTTIWWQQFPDPSNFLTHLMTYGTFSDAGRMRLDELITTSYKEHDTDKRRSIFESINSLMAEEGSIVPLLRHHETWFLSKNVSRIFDSGYTDSTRNFAPVDATP